MLLCSVSASGKYYEARRYDVNLQLDSRGGLTVTETAVFRFVAGPFTFVFREIAATETDGIANVHAWFNGRPCALRTGSGEVEISGSSPVMVRWHFTPLMTGSHTFTLKYRVAGTVRPDGDSQAFAWRALRQQNNYRVAASEIVLEYPPGIEPRVVALRSPAPRFEIGRGRAGAVLVNPPMGEDVVVYAKFPAGSFSSPPQEWISARERKAAGFQRGARVGTAVSAIYLALACLWMFRIRAASRPGETSLGRGELLASPPTSLPPALAGRLTVRAGLSLGTRLDLARRGVLRIEEGARGFLRSRQFQVVLCNASAGLASHERVLLDLVFPKGETTVNLPDFFTRQSSRGKFVSAIRGEMQADGMLDEARIQARKGLLIAGGIGLAAGFAQIMIGVAQRKSAESSFVAANAMVVG